MEVFIAAVDDAVLGATCSDEAQTLENIVNDFRTEHILVLILRFHFTDNTFVFAASSTAFSVETPSLG